MKVLRQPVFRFPCRKHECGNPARQGMACCSTECRNHVPNCEAKNCTNAKEPCIYKGVDTWSVYCRQHGGRVLWDKDQKERKFAKPKQQWYVWTSQGWKHIY